MLDSISTIYTLNLKLRVSHKSANKLTAAGVGVAALEVDGDWVMSMSSVDSARPAEAGDDDSTCLHIYNAFN